MDIPYNRFILQRSLLFETFCGNLLKFFLRKSTQNWFRILQYPAGTSHVATLMMAFFVSFQRADSKTVDPLLTAIPVSTVMAANKEMNR